MATKTISEQASIANKPYFGDEPEQSQSHLFTLGDADKIALDTVRALTEVMNAAARLQETRIFDAVADMRTDLLAVQQSLSLTPNGMNEQVEMAHARLNAQALPSLNAIEQAITQRLEQGNVPEGIDAAAEQKAITEAFGRVQEGFNHLMPQQPATEQPAPQQPFNGVDPNHVGATVKGKFTEMQQRLAGNQPQQPKPEQEAPQSHVQAEKQRRETAMAGAQGRTGPG